MRFAGGESITNSNSNSTSTCSIYLTDSMSGRNLAQTDPNLMSPHTRGVIYKQSISKADDIFGRNQEELLGLQVKCTSLTKQLDKEEKRSKYVQQQVTCLVQATKNLVDAVVDNPDGIELPSHSSSSF